MEDKPEEKKPKMFIFDLKSLVSTEEEENSEEEKGADEPLG